MAKRKSKRKPTRKQVVDLAEKTGKEFTGIRRDFRETVAAVCGLFTLAALLALYMSRLHERVSFTSTLLFLLLALFIFCAFMLFLGRNLKKSDTKLHDFLKEKGFE